MKNALLLTLLFIGSTVLAQTIKVSPTELAFLQSTTVVNFSVDLSKTKMGSFNSIEEWVQFRYEEIKLKDNEKSAKDWKDAFYEALKQGETEFKDDFNAKFVNSAVRLKEGATTVEYTAVLHVHELNVPEGFGNKPVEIKGQLVFSKGGSTVF